jgi:hypothetical protein
MTGALEALQHRAVFNVVNTTTGWKADLIARKLRPFSEDDAYLEHWIAELGLLEQWRAARRAAETT